MFFGQTCREKSLFFRKSGGSSALLAHLVVKVHVWPLASKTALALCNSERRTVLKSKIPDVVNCYNLVSIEYEQKALERAVPDEC